jgi:tetratricopeptide (TPR) repeat protein
MGGVYLWSRRHDEAVREFEKSISLDPNFALGYMMLGLSLYYGGKSERALDVFDRAFALDLTTLTFTCTSRRKRTSSWVSSKKRLKS